MGDNVFEQLAKKYDTEKQMELAEVIIGEVRQELQNSTLKSFIDYGGGTGLIGLELADQVDSVLVVDSSEQMLEVVKTKISKREIKNANVLHSDFTDRKSVV